MLYSTHTIALDTAGHDFLLAVMAFMEILWLDLKISNP